MAEPAESPIRRPEPATVLRADEVRVEYPSTTGMITALAGVTLRVPASGITVFAGPSGSGKSTLLRVLGLIERPTSGRVRLRERDITELGSRQRRALRRTEVALVFQNPPENLLDYLTTAENLRAAAQSAGRPVAENALLERLGLPGIGSWRVSALSGGQQQRLAFGCALARGSTVVLADEPTSQLDTTSAELVLNTMRRLADEGVPVVVSSHDPRLIEIGDRVSTLRDGRLGDPSGGEW